MIFVGVQYLFFLANNDCIEWYFLFTLFDGFQTENKIINTVYICPRIWDVNSLTDSPQFYSGYGKINQIVFNFL
jgi:hypothetical protein